MCNIACCSVQVALGIPRLGLSAAKVYSCDPILLFTFRCHQHRIFWRTFKPLTGYASRQRANSARSKAQDLCPLPLSIGDCRYDQTPRVCSLIFGFAFQAHRESTFKVLHSEGFCQFEHGSPTSSGSHTEANAVDTRGVSAAASQPLSGKTVVITGVLTSLSRTEAEDLARRLGARCVS